jgi:acetylornithine/succinyldiaminopimelate/putrescine aminotransferase/predicted amino acid dehydrogenase
MLTLDFPKTARAKSFRHTDDLFPENGFYFKNPDSGIDSYFHFVKPGLKNQLGLLGLDVVYNRGLLDRLYYTDRSCKEVEILDLVGGFGACLLGHNHPDIRSVLLDRTKYDRPNLVQGSVHAESGLLGKRLSMRLSSVTGKSYVCIFGNSGADAVDIAMKHSELERIKKIDELKKNLHREFTSIKKILHDKGCSVDPNVLHQTELFKGKIIPDSLEECLYLIENHNLKVFSRSPIYIALRGAFHGKSVGALSLTYNADYRRPFAGLLQESYFLDAFDKKTLGTTFEESLQNYYALKWTENSSLEIHQMPLSNIAALFVESIQGEGGIVPIGKDFLKDCRSVCDEYGIPMIFDEIQSGLGRTGKFFASEHTGVFGDIYLLSKSLGGGIAKISATLVDRNRYVNEFSLIHSSTFAEDPISSAIGNRVLDVLERDHIMKMAEEKGFYLQRGLVKLIEQYPGTIDTVRGKGLMLGVVLASQENSDSIIIREIDRAGRFGYFASGYLFHQHNIRILPTLSAPRVLRIEPSAYISYMDLDKVLHAFERLCEVLTENNTYELLRYVADERTITKYQKKTYPKEEKIAQNDSSVPKVAFLVHYIHEGQLKAIDPSFGIASAKGQDRFIRNIMSVAKPMHINSTDITSVSGRKINFNFILVPITSRHMVEFLKDPSGSPALDMVEDAVRSAYEMGCEVVGLGQYTSIISNNGFLIKNPGLTITTGNSNTVAVSVRAIMKAVSMRGLDPSCISLSLVGAAGNIGASYSVMISNYFSKINLVGSSKLGSLERLEIIRAKIFQNAYRILSENRSDSNIKMGVVQRLSKSPIITKLIDENADQQSAWEAVSVQKKTMIDDLISVSTDIKSIARSDVIVAVSNSPEKIIRDALVRKNAIICDVSVPSATDPSLIRKREDVLYFTGGIVKLPNQEAIKIPAYPLPAGQIFACMAETMLLGLSGIRENFSFGDLKIKNIELIDLLGKYHGFELGPLKTSAVF